MANTPNLNLVKPASTDNYDVAVQNGNMDIIDAAVKALQDGTTAAQVLTKILSVDGAGSGLDADKLDGHEGSYYRNADQVDGLHFQLNNGVLEYSLDGGSWSPVGLICTKPRQAILTQTVADKNVWYTLLSVSGKGKLSRVEMNFGGAIVNQYHEIELTIDGVATTLSGANAAVRGLSDSGSTTREYFSGWIGSIEFLSSLKIRVRHTSTNPNALNAVADYALV